jgi:hypothetical protein
VKKKKKPKTATKDPTVLVRSLEFQPLGAFLGRPADDFPNINAVETVRRLAGADLPFPHRLTGYGRF